MKLNYRLYIYVHYYFEFSLSNTSQPAHDVSGTSPEGPTQKTNELMKKLFSRHSGSCVTHLFLFFAGRTNNQKF